MDRASRRHEFTLRVSLAEGAAVTDHVWGSICLPDGAVPAEAQLLLHGATYDSWYWDPTGPDSPLRDSYVEVAADAGHATVVIDRVGSGRSSRPDPEAVTTEAHAHVVHQVVQALLAGDLGVPQFESVMLVGHSYGSVIAILESARYRDVSALTLTGFAHCVTARFGEFIDSLRPAHTDGDRFHGLAPGYLTTPPDARAAFHDNDTPAGVIAVDEQRKGVHTTGEIGDALKAAAESRQVTAPVLVIVGDQDPLFDIGKLRDEPAEWSRTCAHVVVAPGAGHSLALSSAACRVAHTALEWASRPVEARCAPVAIATSPRR